MNTQSHASEVRVWTLFPAVAFVALGVAACDGGDGAVPADDAREPANAAPALSVYTGSYPLQFFAQRIGGDRVEARFPAPPEADPSTWSPGAEVILAYQDADLILLNGAEYEGWVATATLPAGRVIDTSAAFADEIIVVEDGQTHSHGPEGEHSHNVTASVTWLDLGLAERQAAAVRDALAARDPESAGAYAAGFEALAAELRALDERLRTVAQSAAGRTLVAAGPGYEYLERRYGLTLEHAPFDPANPGAHDFWHEVEHALGHGAERTMIIPLNPNAEMRERLDAMGIDAIVFEPLGGHPSRGDFLSVMGENLGRMEAGLSETGS